MLLFGHISVFASVLHRMILIGRTHSSQFMEWQNLCITKLQHATCAPNVFKTIAGKSNDYRFYLPNFLKFVIISHINYWDQVNSWKSLRKFWNDPLWRNKAGPFSLLNIAAYCKSSNNKACGKKLSQILANNIDNGGRWIGFRILTFGPSCNWLGKQTLHITQHRPIQTWMPLQIYLNSMTFVHF